MWLRSPEGVVGVCGLSASVGFVFGGLLLFYHFLLFALCFFEACHESVFLFGFFGVLCHLASYVVFFDYPAADGVGLEDCDEE